MRLRERFGNRQSEAEPAKPSLDRSVALFERIENPLHQLGLDADTGIVHAEVERLRRRIFRRDRDLAILAA